MSGVGCLTEKVSFMETPGGGEEATWIPGDRVLRWEHALPV